MAERQIYLDIIYFGLKYEERKFPVRMLIKYHCSYSFGRSNREVGLAVTCLVLKIIIHNRVQRVQNNYFLPLADGLKYTSVLASGNA